MAVHVGSSHTPHTQHGDNPETLVHVPPDQMTPDRQDSHPWLLEKKILRWFSVIATNSTHI